MSDVKRVAAKPDVLWQEVDGVVVLLAMHSDRCYRLDEVGSRMWRLLHELGDVDAMRDQLLAEFDVDRDRLAEELDAFLGDLMAAGLLAVGPGHPA